MVRTVPFVLALGVLSGCPSPHAMVRSCDEAADAPDGTACEGFVTCPPIACTLRVTCDRTIRRRPDFDCEEAGARRPARDVDAGACAPRAPDSGAGCHVSSDCDAMRSEACFAPDAMGIESGTSSSCFDGAYACPAHTRCERGALGDRHGCVRAACAFDADCGCGAACIGGGCYDTLGTCAPSAITPGS